jgi:hypothetical protein
VRPDRPSQPCAAWLCSLLLALVGGSSSATAADAPASAPTPAAVPATAPTASAPTARSADPYCGVYCIYTALRLADRPADFRNLLDPQYISSRQGSSLAELGQKRGGAEKGISTLICPPAGWAFYFDDGGNGAGPSADRTGG